MAHVPFRTLVLAGSFSLSACATPAPPAAGTAAAPGALVSCPSPAEDPALPTYDSLEVERRAVAGPGAVHSTYPERLRQRGVRGRVEARWVVQRDGCVDQASIELTSDSDSAFVTEVRRVLRRSRFEPALYRGTPVRQRMATPFIWDFAPGSR